MADEMILCPHCGSENLPNATRCVHCGKELEQLFKIDGVEGIAPVPEAGDELPEMLKAFREEERHAQSHVQPEPTPAEPDQTPVLPQGEPAASDSTEPKVPDWLARIRARAAEEADASGELARRAGTRDQIQTSGQQSELDKEFSSWIERLREGKQQEAMRRARRAAQESQTAEGIPEWLRKIRELQPEAEEEETQPIESIPAEEESLVEPISQPEEAEQIEAALEETQPLPEAAAPAAEAETPQTEEPIPAEPELSPEAEPAAPPEAAEILAPIVEELGIPPLPPEVESPKEEIEAAEAEGTPQDLLLLRSQKERANVLRNLIAEEGKAFPPPRTAKPARKDRSRLVVGCFLLLALLMTLIFVPAAPVGEGNVPAHAIALQEALQELTTGTQVLVVLEYQPATSRELEQIAVPVLRYLEQRGVELQLLATQPSGLWLAQSLTKAAGITPAPQAAYLPGGTLGVFALGVDSNRTSPLLPAGMDSLTNYRAILLLEDSGSQFQVWMEQAAPWLGKGRFLVLNASQDAAMVLPYYDSGQVAGYAAGTQEGAALAQSLSQQPSGLAHSRAIQVGLIVMMVIMILGMVSKAEKDSASRREEEKA